MFVPAGNVVVPAGRVYFASFDDFDLSPFSESCGVFADFGTLLTTTPTVTHRNCLV